MDATFLRNVERLPADCTELNVGANHGGMAVETEGGGAAWSSELKTVRMKPTAPAMLALGDCVLPANGVRTRGLTPPEHQTPLQPSARGALALS
jgi:hypothetical protein